MTRKEIAKKVFAASCGIVKASELLDAGLSKADISVLYKAGYLERVRHGFYRLAENTGISEELLLKTLLPEGIVAWNPPCFISATAILRHEPGRWRPRTISVQS